MKKTETGIDAISYPMPCSLVGANIDGKPNYLTVAFFSMVNVKPPFIAVSLGKIHYTNPGIKENGTFSVNIPSKEMIEAIDYCGIVSGKKYDKSSLFGTFYGKLGTAPMIEECPYNLECKLVQTVELPVDEIFIGEIVAAYSDERYLVNGVPDLGKMDPVFLSMSDRTYWSFGNNFAKAWEVGKKLLK